MMVNRKTLRPRGNGTSARNKAAAQQEWIAGPAALRDKLACDKAVAGLMRQLLERLHTGDELRLLLGRVLETAITVTDAGFGLIQLVDPASGHLRIYVQQGLGAKFLEVFEGICTGQAPCGSVMKTRSQVVVPDVTESPTFSHNMIEVMLDAGVRALQATPLLSGSGELLGVLTTHYRIPGTLDERRNQLLNFIAFSTAACIERWARNTDRPAGGRARFQVP